MNTFIKILLLISVFPLLVSCEGKAVETAFNQIVNDVAEGNADQVLLSFDAESQTYFDQLLAAVRKNDVAKATYLGKKNEVLVSTLLLFDQFVDAGRDTPDSIRIAMATQEILNFTLIMNDVGVFRNSTESPIRIHEGATVSGNRADLSVTVSTGTGAKLATTFIMHKEEGQWKLNFPSTMKGVERVYAQGLRSSGLTSYQYAQRLNRSGGNGLSFSYDRNYRE